MRNAVAGFLELSEEVLRVQRVGSRQEFGYRLAWARTKAQQKGLVERIDVATWKITDLGETSILK
jgi:restriction endonuclease Mrr